MGTSSYLTLNFVSLSQAKFKFKVTLLARTSVLTRKNLLLTTAARRRQMTVQSDLISLVYVVLFLNVKCQMEPGEIKKLDLEVVNRIAAGEIIQRPCNALKEMIENSLDAKSNLIQISVKAGGLKLLQIQDNGTGIRKDDLPIVAERFTTSKLEKFEDLNGISTFGFRGEALASISHVAHLTIQTKTRSEKCAYKASYEDGRFKSVPKSCAGNQGTTITVEDLFYNMPQRRQALKSPAEEFTRVSEVVSKYAVHNPHVGFTLKKVGESGFAIKTPAKSSHHDNIKIIYGSQIAKDLLPLELQDSVHRFKIKGFITSCNYQSKGRTNLVFINHRLVESLLLKAAIDSVYGTFLPRGVYPFYYLGLELDPLTVDVNVHPTKHEVHFLYEEDIVEKIKMQVESTLLASNVTKTVYKQLTLPGAPELNETANTSAQDSDRTYAKDTIRTDTTVQKLDKFLINPDKSISESPKSSLKKETKLSSVIKMRQAIEKKCSKELHHMFKNFVFIGVVNRKFTLFQSEAKLILCDIIKCSQELFYQIMVNNFENFQKIQVYPPLSVKDLLIISLETEDSGWTEEDGAKEELAQRALEILKEKSAMMSEYFNLHINENGELETLPCLLENHRPPLQYLALYMLWLATEVDWSSERECFETFCRETAKFYSILPEEEDEDDLSYKTKWTLEHVICPAIRKNLQPGDKMIENVYELTSLGKLYKIFERC